MGKSDYYMLSAFITKHKKKYILKHGKSPFSLLFKFVKWSVNQDSFSICVSAKFHPMKEHIKHIISCWPNLAKTLLHNRARLKWLPPLEDTKVPPNEAIVTGDLIVPQEGSHSRG